jgi:DNA modification methylase
MAYLLVKSDCRRGIPLADQSVHTIVTSPPYWGLRDYGESNQIGLESTPEAYVARMVGVFRELRRVLRDDGTVWLNLGDSYSSGARKTNKPSGNGVGHRAMKEGRPMRAPVDADLKPKDLVGIPWRVALALQADGWHLRSDIIWAKPNPMPESVTDRPTKSHEYLFLLSKRERYYYDGEAIKEPSIENDPRRPNGRGQECLGHSAASGARGEKGTHDPSTRNKRSVWTVPLRPFPGAHFATFPPDLIEPCIKAGSSEKGCCGACGAPWVRIVKKEKMVIRRTARSEDMGEYGRTQSSGTMVTPASSETIGWKPSCKCPASDPVPCMILDPFNGAGTTPIVSLALGRHAIGFDLSPKYLRMARRRIERPHARPERPARNESLPLFGAID